MVSAGLPAARAASTSISATTCSHPSATTSTAPTLGCAQYAASVVCVSCMSGPSCPQPARCGSATTDDGSASAMRSLTTDAQITVGTTSTWFRTPTRWSGRTNPQKPARSLMRSSDRLDLGARAGVLFRFGETHATLGRHRPRLEIAAAAAARQVVRVHVRSPGNRRCRHADGAAVLDDRLAGGEIHQRDLVARRNALAHRQAAAADLDRSPGLERLERRGHVVAIADDERRL